MWQSAWVFQAGSTASIANSYLVPRIFKPAEKAASFNEEAYTQVNLSGNDFRQNPRGGAGSEERPAHGPLDCVCISCFPYDIEFLQCLLSYTEIRLHRAETLEKADFLLTVTGSRVLISDTVFLDGFWTDALEMVARFHPLSSFFVAADPVDQEFAGDAVDRGACAVLRKPLDFAQLIRWIRTGHEAALERSRLEENVRRAALGAPSCDEVKR